MTIKFSPKIRHVKVLDDYIILIIFDNGTKKQYDFKSKLDMYPYITIKNPGVFKSVQIDAGGYGLSWNDEVDISEYELWTNGINI